MPKALGQIEFIKSDWCLSISNHVVMHFGDDKWLAMAEFKLTTAKVISASFKMAD